MPRWYKVKGRMHKLEEKQAELLEEYNSTAELVKEDIEEQDLESLRHHIADLEDILQDLRAVRDELGHLCDIVDDAVDDELMRRHGVE